ncbi:phosphoribosyltransferase family protein, partial [Allorhizocola rhizosphaerae]|uniref:phosphoribosyltransferase family protein n=1 Tax=Allorhizocola rhizosphaerae TaxID=1872709 RepID=UPI002482AEF0
ATLRARPRADSTSLDASRRAEAARAAFAVRRAGLAHTARAATHASVVLVDDVITTGVTLAAAADVLAQNGIQVDACVAVAATRRRHPGRGVRLITSGH